MSVSMFTSAVSFKVQQAPQNHTKADFSDSSYGYVVYVEPDLIDERFWEVSFFAVSDDCELILGGFTRANNARRVLSTVIAVIRNHEFRYGTRPLRLQAADDKRCRVYAQMATKLLPDWIITTAGNNVMVLPPAFLEHL